MRPIDGDKLLETIEKERQYLRSRGLYGAEHILVHNFRNLVEDAPTISLPNEQIAWKQGYEYGKNEKRPEGEWIEQKNYPYQKCNLQLGYECNQCGTENPYKANFCPNCGADMRGGAE